MNSKILFDNLWKYLLGFTSVCFLILGSAKIIADQNYYIGSICIITTIFFAFVANLTRKNKFSFDKSTAAIKGLFSFGFTFLIIGLGIFNLHDSHLLYMLPWIFGLGLFLFSVTKIKIAIDEEVS